MQRIFIGLLVPLVLIVNLDQFKGKARGGKGNVAAGGSCATGILFKTSFSTSDDPDWNQDYAQKPDPTNGNICPGPTWNGKQTNYSQSQDIATDNGSCEQINTAANNPSGVGGRGQRHWRGQGHPGPGLVANDVSGGASIAVSGSPNIPELYFRYTSRHQTGFNYTNGTPEDIKEIFFTHTFGQYCGFGGGAGMRCVTNSTFGSNNPVGYEWQNLMGGVTADGLWHTYEWHLKMDTGNATNGTAELKIDNILRLSHTNVNFSQTSGHTGWGSIILGSNGKYPDNADVDFYQDYDDIVIATGGWVGPINIAQCGF